MKLHQLEGFYVEERVEPNRGGVLSPQVILLLFDAIYQAVLSHNTWCVHRFHTQIELSQSDPWGGEQRAQLGEVLVRILQDQGVGSSADRRIVCLLRAPHVGVFHEREFQGLDVTKRYSRSVAKKSERSRDAEIASEAKGVVPIEDLDSFLVDLSTGLHPMDIESFFNTA